MIKSKPVLVTCALPYANGSLHIGHALEYIQGDIYSRFLKKTWHDCIFICADDTHGTPVQIKAESLGLSPEQLIQKYHQEHLADFTGLHIEFDNFDSTNSVENKKYADLFFTRMQEKGYIYQKEMELTYCENCKRFLPDRYVKGECPNCNALDQYGDVCEKCNSAYKTTDLINPYCVVCKNSPVRKKSLHYFFKLSALSSQLRKWLTENKELQQDVVNFCLNWIDKGLEDWCISRDAPYFGFKVAGEEDKYYYVWLDAPIGYISSTENYLKIRGKDVSDYWDNKKGRIVHIIGKDILYFHFLFWPAMLMASGFDLPNKIVVHGHVTINKEKMSKSKGTMISVRDYLNVLNPELLRYYYASGLSSRNIDIDLDANDFLERVNNELVSNFANFFFRVLSFTNKYFDSKIGLPADDAVQEEINKRIEHAIASYESFEFRDAVQDILAISSLGNKYFQDNEPWKLIKEDKEKAHAVVSFAANIAKVVAILLEPITPEFSSQIYKQLNIGEQSFSDVHTLLSNHTINTAEIILKKLLPEDFEKLIEQENAFYKLDLKVAEILDANPHPNAAKLVILDVVIGEDQRQIVAGIAEQYPIETLKGKHIIVVTNLAHAKLRGVESQGMLLAADDDGKIVLLEAPQANHGEQVTLEGVETRPVQELKFDEFLTIPLVVKGHKATCNGLILKIGQMDIAVDATDGARIR